MPEESSIARAIRDQAHKRVDVLASIAHCVWAFSTSRTKYSIEPPPVRPCGQPDATPTQCTCVCVPRGQGSHWMRSVHLFVSTERITLDPIARVGGLGTSGPVFFASQTRVDAVAYVARQADAVVPPESTGCGSYVRSERHSSGASTCSRMCEVPDSVTELALAVRFARSKYSERAEPECSVCDPHEDELVQRLGHDSPSPKSRSSGLRTACSGMRGSPCLCR